MGTPKMIMALSTSGTKKKMEQFERSRKNLKSELKGLLQLAETIKDEVTANTRDFDQEIAVEMDSEIAVFTAMKNLLDPDEEEEAVQVPEL